MAACFKVWITELMPFSSGIRDGVHQIVQDAFTVFFDHVSGLGQRAESVALAFSTQSRRNLRTHARGVQVQNRLKFSFNAHAVPVCRS